MGWLRSCRTWMCPRGCCHGRCLRRLCWWGAALPLPRSRQQICLQPVLPRRGGGSFPRCRLWQLQLRCAGGLLRLQPLLPLPQPHDFPRHALLLARGLRLIRRTLQRLLTREQRKRTRQQQRLRQRALQRRLPHPAKKELLPQLHLHQQPPASQQKVWGPLHQQRVHRLDSMP